jgi:hypothetical protein
MMLECTFELLREMPGGKAVWKCKTCGFVTIPVRGQPHKFCQMGLQPPSVGNVANHGLDYLFLACPHRRQVLATINARAAGCGCSSSEAEVYHCRHFNEPVLKQASARYLDKIKAKVSNYMGRTCRECVVPRESAETTSLSPVSTLVAVTSYFNPQRSTFRRENWFRFAEGLANKGIQLLTVEGVRGTDSPDLPSAHSVRNVQFRDVLWQKERLLNLLIESLPKGVDAVAWLDADLIFDEPNLKQKILDGLSRWPILQPWSKAWMHNADSSIQYWGTKRTIVSLASVNKGKGQDAAPNQKHPGFAWAARREVLIAMGGLYDRHITGGGDTAMALGFYGDFNSGYLQHDRMSPTMMRHWLSWANQSHNIIKNRVGYIEGLLHHLYHGEIPDRGYKYRWTRLAKAGYDPARHVRVSETGALEWTEEAPEQLKRYVEDYLLNQRKEP